MSTERDQELDELQRELSQPIEPPEEVGEGEGQTCFINQDRLCRPDCTAFNSYAELKQGPERCILLVYLSHTAANTTELVGLGTKLAKITKIRAADEARVAIAAQPVPDPFGG